MTIINTTRQTGVWEVNNIPGLTNVTFFEAFFVAETTEAREVEIARLPKSVRVSSFTIGFYREEKWVELPALAFRVHLVGAAPTTLKRLAAFRRAAGI